MMLRLLILLALCWPSASWAAITRTGSFSTEAHVTNTGSFSVTVPADAEIMVLGVTGFQSTASYFSSGSVTVGGAAMTAVGFDSDTTKFQGSLFYKVLPATGTQTVAFDWAGTTAPEFGVIFVYAFYKGIDTASTIRSSNGAQQATNPHATSTLTAQSGDLIVAWMAQFTASESTVTWTGATEVQAVTAISQTDGSWAEASPTGNQTVSASGSDNQDGGVGAIVLKPAGGGGGGSTSRNFLLLGVGP